MSARNRNTVSTVAFMIGILTPALVIVAIMSVNAAENPADMPNVLGDKDITNAVEMNFLVDDGIPGANIDVKTQEGIVTLSGDVDTILGRDRAVAVAQAVRGVRSVVDKIAVSPVERANEELEKDVMSALETDPAADSYEIGVTVDDGVVKLTGTVESWAERRLAENTVKGVRGVKDLVNEIAVRFTEPRPDAEIKTDVERALEIDVVTSGKNINVDVRDGAVTLSGQVASAAEAMRAMNKAWVNGVKSVDAANLVITWWAEDQLIPKPGPMTDQEIKEAVEDAFLFDPRLWSFNPSVRVEDGRVTLTGEVENLRAKQAAEDTAMNTVGVRRVKNLLRVRPEGRPSDAVLADRVREALRRDPYVERFKVDVSAFNGKVYLNGSVDSGFEKSRARRVAAGISGVIAVDNNLAFTEDWTWKDDRTLKQDVQSQLFWSPFVDSDRVTVDVDHGTVTLLGSVSTWAEYRAARENAKEAGARHVRNRLSVRPTRVQPWF